jgi:hypothetical protein
MVTVAVLRTYEDEKARVCAVVARRGGLAGEAEAVAIDGD